MRSAVLALTLSAAAVCGHAADEPAADSKSRDQLEHQIQHAQERLEQAAHEVAELSMKLDGKNMQSYQFFSGSPRPTLGIRVRRPPGTDETNGVVVVSVSPGGPADVAGLKANDVITTFDGKTLHSETGHPAQQELLTLTREAKTDKPVVIEIKRDGKTQQLQVTPKSTTGFLEMPEPPQPPELLDLEGLNHMFIGRDRSGIGSAELLDLTPGLGSYFGTDKGLLVVRAPHDERFKLLEGDVILDIDGRVPESASHAMQILNSYRRGEKLRLHIMRQQKRMELPIEIPAESGHAELSLRGFVGGDDARGID
jgi:S1-C subfamily serine protease